MCIILLLFFICLRKSFPISITKVGDFSDNPLSYSVFICFWNGYLSTLIFSALYPVLQKQFLIRFSIHSLSV